MTALVLALLAAVDGGTASGFADPLYAKCTEAPPAVQLDGGPEADWLTPHVRMQRTACLMATCEDTRSAQAKQLREAPVPPSWAFWAFGLALATVGGFLLGTALNLFGR